MHFSFYSTGAGQNVPEQGSMPSHVDFLKWVISGRVQFAEYNHAGKTPIGTPAFVPAVFDGKGRKQENVVCVTALVVDIDKEHTAKIAPILASFHMRKIPYSAYTTASYNQDQIASSRISLRLTIPLKTPVPNAAWKNKRISMLRALGMADITDSQTVNADRLYYVPATRYKDLALHKQWSAWLDESPLDPDAYNEIHTTSRSVSYAGTPTPVNTSATSDDNESKEPSLEEKLNKLCGALNRRGDKSTHTTMRKLLDGSVYTTEKDRDAKLFVVAAAIARFYPKEAYTRSYEIALFFKQSIEATNRLFDERGDAHTESDLRKVVEKLQRTAIHRLQELEDAKKELDQDKRQRRRQARLFLGEQPTTDDPYSQEEFASLIATIPQEDIAENAESDMGRLHDQLKKRWIVQFGTAFYTLSKNGYLGPYPTAVMESAVLRDLSLAETLGVEIYKTAAFQKQDVAIADQLKSSTELMQDYGSLARNVVVDLSAQRSSYSERTQELVEAPCPIREELLRDAVLDRRVAEWLWCFAGEDADLFGKINQFLAYLPRLEHPSVALYIDGVKGVGKTLFATACSRVWSKTGPTMMEAVAGGFNDSVIRNPLVFADEFITKEIHEHGTRFLRRYQQDNTEKIRTKYVPDRDRRGYIRLIIAANSKNIIGTDRHMTQADIDAIDERFLYINVHPKAALYLERLRSIMDPRDIANKDLLAKHALALYKAHLRDKIQTRFLITTPGDSALTAELSTNTGIRSVICHWLILYLKQPKKLDALNTAHIVIREGRLLVNPEAFINNWKLYETNALPPQTSVITSALESLSTGQSTRTIPGKGKITYFDFNIKMLAAWSQRTAISSEEDIKAALTKNTFVQEPVNAMNVIPMRRI